MKDVAHGKRRPWRFVPARRWPCLWLLSRCLLVEDIMGNGAGSDAANAETSPPGSFSGPGSQSLSGQL